MLRGYAKRTRKADAPIVDVAGAITKGAFRSGEVSKWVQRAFRLPVRYLFAIYKLLMFQQRKGGRVV